MTFVSIDTSSGAVRSAAAASTIRAASRRLLGGRQMTGGKGGNPFWGPYSGGKVLLEGLRDSANAVAEIAYASKNCRPFKSLNNQGQEGRRPPVWSP